MAHVSIGKRFLSEVRSQYEDWHAAYVREAFQNCVDAPGSRDVRFTIEGDDDGNTVVMFTNDGRPMSRDEIEDKLLTLGETGKGHSGTVGGFGRAKELLYFCHERYSIESSDCKVTGEGCSYELVATETSYPGTRSFVVIEGDHVYELVEALRTCVGYSHFNGTVRLNGVELDERTRRGRKRDWEGGEGWCRVYTSRQHEGLMLVRVGGVFMYAKSLYDYKGTVVCELDTSYETLTSNRDGLRSSYRWKLDEFIESVSTNRRAAFKPKAPKFRRYVGTKLSAPITRTFEIDTETADKQAPASWRRSPDLLAASVATGPAAGGNVGIAELAAAIEGKPGAADPVDAVAGGTLAAADPVASEEDATLVYGGHVAVKHDFILRNELCDDVKVPVYYDPGEAKFSPYSRWLASTWAKCMVELHALFEKRDAFSVGFIFDEDDPDDGSCEALHEVRRGSNVYYVSPCRVKRGANGRSEDARRLVPRWKRRDKWSILTVAAHEFVHGEGHDRHNEAYANRLTDVLGRVLAEKSRFSHCFRV